MLPLFAVISILGVIALLSKGFRSRVIASGFCILLGGFFSALIFRLAS